MYNLWYHTALAHQSEIKEHTSNVSCDKTYTALFIMKNCQNDHKTNTELINNYNIDGLPCSY